jgi:CheY-like chemotaxis protein
MRIRPASGLLWISAMLSLLKSWGELIFNRPAESDAEEPRRWAAKHTVLAIDDDATFLSILRPALLDQGFNVLACTSGAKALTMLKYAPRDIDLVTLDFHMPSLSGTETLQYVRQLNPSVKVVALTGVDNRLVPEDFRKGVDCFLAKPLRCSELIQVIQSLLCGPAVMPEPFSA